MGFHRAMRSAPFILRLWLPAALIVSLASGDARAADPAAADVLFREGRRAADAGNYITACAKFEESNRLDPAPGTLLNLADCEENRGQLARAWQHFEELYDAVPPSDERHGIAGARARSLEKRLPKLRILLASSLPSIVKRDDTVLSSSVLGVVQPVDPGRHVIVVSSPGRWDQRYEVELGEGQGKEIAVSPGELVQPPAPLPPVAATMPLDPSQPLEPSATGPTTAGSPRRTAAYVVGGFGAASLLTGTVFGVAALTQLSASNAHCTGNVCANEGAINQFHSAQSFALVADVTLGVGVACVVTAVVLGITGSHHGSEASLPLWLQGRF
jgi:hypothetical protein